MRLCPRRILPPRLLPCLLSVLLAAACREKPPTEKGDHPQAGKADRHPKRPDAKGQTKGPPAKAVPPKERGEVDPSKPQTLVFIVMDTVRASSTSLCGYERPTTPFLEKLRDDLGAAWTCDAYAPATWTMPSHTSYFTGKSIPEHGHDRLGVKLPDNTGPLLAEQLKERGFQTLMFAANPALAKSGLQRGFDRVRIAKDMLELREPDFAKEFESELRKADPSKPLFVFVNLIDAHDPYPAVPEGVAWAPAQPRLDLHVRVEDEDRSYHEFLRGELPPERTERYLTAIRNGYDQGISMEDNNVRSVVRLLKQHGRLDGPLRLVVTADHGEFIGEQGLLRHAAYLYEPVVKVPFLYLDNTLDVQPELPHPMSATTSHSLVLDGRLPEPALPVTSWSRRMDDRPVKPGEDMTSSWEADSVKLLWWNGQAMRFDLAADPAEANPQPIAPADVPPAFNAQVEQLYRHLEATAGLPTDPATVEALRGLGYLE